MRPIQQNLSCFAAVTNSIATAQTPTLNANLTLNGTLVSGGVATLLTPATVSLTSTNNFSTVTFTVIGTDASGNTISEAIAGPNNNTVQTTKVYATVTQIQTDAPSGLTTETVSAGNTAVGLGPTAWWPLDIYTPNQVTSISGTIVSGSLTYSVQYTNEDPFDTTITQQVVSHPVAALVGASTSQTGFTTTLMRAVRFNIASGTGVLRATVVQQSTQ
jgi:hypothetical protein